MNLLPRPVATAIVVAVTAIWASNFLLQFVVDGYEPDAAINAIFMAIMGGAIALSRGKGDPPAPPPGPGPPASPSSPPTPPTSESKP